jgi:hypothetical protein
MSAWIQTRSGLPFDFRDGGPEQIRIEDIGSALSKLCRFTGHTREFYSVAEHSVLVSLLVPEEFALEGLLHDAHEAYVGDMSTPLKRALRPAGGLSGYDVVESEAEHRVRALFGLSKRKTPPVAKADVQAMIAERSALMAPSSREWNLNTTIPMPSGLLCLAPALAERLFMGRVEWLSGAKDLFNPFRDPRDVSRVENFCNPGMEQMRSIARHVLKELAE